MRTKPPSARLGRALNPVPHRLARLAVAAAALVCLPVAGASAAEERAYEMVSPPDKGGFPLHKSAVSQAALGGGAVAYIATGAFGGSPASLMFSAYVSRREESGWSTVAANAPQLLQGGNIGQGTRFFSDSLDTAMQFSSVATVPGAIDGGSNLYRQDTLTGGRTLVAAGADLSMFGENVKQGVKPLVDGTGDLSHFVFLSRTPLLPGVPSQVNLYEVAGDDLRLVNRRQDGSILGNPRLREDSVDMTMGRNISRDGRRIFFQSPATSTGSLYVRIDGESTEALSISHRPGDPATPQHGTFVGASDDGTIVYFKSRSQLTADAGPGTGNIYRLDTETDELTVVTRPLDPGATVGLTSRVWGVSPDGSNVYFSSVNELAPGAPPIGPFGGHVYHYEHGSGVRLVATFPTGGEESPNRVRVSDNGRFLVFTTAARPTGFDNVDSDCKTVVDGEVRCEEVFVYDAVSGDLRCVSCLHDDGDNADSRSGLQSQAIGGGYRARSVLDDGTVFFTSAEALVASDVNGAEDVYSWRDGVVSLISSGRDPRGSQFADASADGRDVFFMTYERLVAVDTDDEVDMYDARVGGGIAAQQVSPPSVPDCMGDGCQGALEAGPVVSAIGSLGLSGRGDADVSRPVRAAISLVRGSRRGASFAVRVRAPGRGRITASGRGVRSKGRSVRRAGTYRLRLSLNKAGRRTLARKGKVRIGARVTFRPASGRPSARTVAVTLRSPVGGKAGSR